MAMLENKTKTPPFDRPENKALANDREEIYCSVEDLKTRSTRNPRAATASPTRGALKELSFNKVIRLHRTVRSVITKQSRVRE